jgi:hypothetical protein
MKRATPAWALRRVDLLKERYADGVSDSNLNKVSIHKATRRQNLEDHGRHRMRAPENSAERNVFLTKRK